MGLESIVKVVTASKQLEKERFVTEDAEILAGKQKRQNILETKELWKKCKYRKKVNEEEYCTFFMAKCAKEKCDRKYMKL